MAMSKETENRLQNEVSELNQHLQLQQKTLDASNHLISKLANTAKGHVKELDNQLAKLRKKVKGKASLEELIESYGHNASLVKEFDAQQLSAITELKQTMLIAGEALQGSKGLDSNLRRELRMVVNKLKSGGLGLYSELQPVVIHLLDILTAAKKGDSSDKSTKPSSNDSLKIAGTLLAGLEKLSLSSMANPKLEKQIIKVKRLTGEREQVNACLIIFDQIISQFSEEYKQTQNLVLNINSALEEVHQILVKSLNNSKSYDKQLAELNRKINHQILELSTNAEQASSIDQLQSIIDKKLELITVSIKERESIEQQRASELDNALTIMESKLSQMEQRTEFYRNKWLEEKARSETDALTGLPNRGAYDKRFEEEVHRWQRQPHPLCLAMIDIDHFKQINDSYGHAVGDKTLQVVAKTLRKTFRTSDYIARYGGEEFACLIINTDENEINVPLEKVRKSIESIPFTIKNDRVNITISIGATMFTEHDNIHTVFDRADKALYEAKKTGRNKICYIK